ncbi:MAG: HepT-like ribonuclease domain-containing protein [Cyanobacteriota bacterium]
MVGFRNLLAHGYGTVGEDAVFRLVFADLLVLKG